MNTGRLRTFVTDFTQLAAASHGDEAVFFSTGKALLHDLIGVDDWLPRSFAQPNPARYQQYLLHCDPLERFSVVSFVWDGGQATPIHNHTVWGMVGVLRGAEIGTRYAPTDQGVLAAGPEERLEEGGIELVSPTVGDVHLVRNARRSEPSISIHVYGANIGAVRRATYAADGAAREFISGYANAVTPNLWDRST